jgi:hypothetical protein
MRIECFLLAWNEISIMPFVIRHYQKFCDKITIYDNHSTDGSAELARSMGCEVIPFGDKFFNDQHNMEVKNNCWKGSDADWVIVADFDEIMIPSRSQLLPYFKNDDWYVTNEWDGITIFKTIGWQIMSEEMPKDDLLEITNGYRFDNYSKNVIFNPKEIHEINYNPGAHRCNPIGNVVWSEEHLYVLHYKHIGGVERTIKRYREYQKRMSKINRQRGWGVHYNQTPVQLRKEWNERMAISKSLI